MSTGNPTVLRTLNERAALELLLEHGSLTRAELEAHTGLSKASAAEVLRRLEHGRLVRKAGRKPGNAGPAAQMWKLDGGAAAVAGVDLTARAVEVSVADLTGTVRTVHASPAPEPGDDQVEFLASVVETAAREAGLDPADLDQIVVGVPGIVDPRGARLRQAVQLTGWTGLGDLSGLHARLGRDRLEHSRVGRVVLENDVNLVARREQAEQSGSFVLFWVGAGVGAGTVLGGELWRGVTGRGGEVGSVVVPDPVTRGRRFGPDGGLLGELLGAAPLAELAAAHGLTAEPTTPAVAALLAASAGTPFLTDVSARVALGVIAAVGVLDPGRVVLAGPLCVAAGAPLRDLVAARLTATSLAQVEIVLTAVSGGDAVLDGALRYALDLARERVFQAGTAGRAGSVY